MVTLKKMLFALLLLLNFPVYADDEDEFKYSNFFQVKTLAKEALEQVTLKASEYGKTKELRLAIVASLTNMLLDLKKKYNIDFAIISNEKNNTKELLEKGILFVTLKLRYQDKKGKIAWELTSVISPDEIDFYSIIDDNKEIDQDEIYAYRRLYR